MFHFMSLQRIKLHLAGKLNQPTESLKDWLLLSVYLEVKSVLFKVILQYIAEKLKTQKGIKNALYLKYQYSPVKKFKGYYCDYSIREENANEK